MTTTTPQIGVRPEDAAAIVDIVRRLTAAWAKADADTMAALYAEDASVILPGDRNMVGPYLKGRPAIRDWMANAFATKWKGTHILGKPLEFRYLTDDLILFVSEGGAYEPGWTEVPDYDAIRGMWVFERRGDELTIVSYANNRIGVPMPVPENVGG